MARAISERDNTNNEIGEQEDAISGLQKSMRQHQIIQDLYDRCPKRNVESTWEIGR
jgi:hypothetical protein